VAKGSKPGVVGVVENDEASRRAIARVLHAGGFEAAVFESAEAFIASPPKRPLVCLIVDVHLAGMSGIDLQQQLHSAGSEVPVIVTTGDRTDMIRERARQAGCAAFLWKPFSARTILTLLSSIARQSRT
jgi:FixJ family two-component response regulator